MAGSESLQQKPNRCALPSWDYQTVHSRKILRCANQYDPFAWYSRRPKGQGVFVEVSLDRENPR